MLHAFSHNQNQSPHHTSIYILMCEHEIRRGSCGRKKGTKDTKEKIRCHDVGRGEPEFSRI